MNRSELIRIALDARLMDLHTAMPGRVEKYDASEQKADIKPQLKRAVPNGQGGFVLEELPVLPSVQVGWPRGGGFFCSFPLQKGDYVWVMFAERSLDAWRRTGEPTDPGDLRMHSLAGAYCIPGCAPSSGALADASADNLVIGKDGASGAQIVITPTGIQLGSGADDAVLTKKDFLAFLKAWADAGPGTTDGGALMRTNTLATLAAPPYNLVPASQPEFGSPYVKAKR